MSQHFRAIREASAPSVPLDDSPDTAPRDRTAPPPRHRFSDPEPVLAAQGHTQTPAVAGQTAQPPVRIPEKSDAPVWRANRVRKWFLRLQDGAICGPVELPVLHMWAAEGRVIPSNDVSQDGRQWNPASSIPALLQYWIDGTTQIAPPVRVSVPEVETKEDAPAAESLSPTPAPVPARRAGCGRASAVRPAKRASRKTRDSQPQKSDASEDIPAFYRVSPGELQMIRNWPQEELAPTT